MQEVILQILPLQLASTLSPGIIAITIFLLGNKINPKKKTLALLIGSFIVGAGVCLIGFFLGQSNTLGAKPKIFYGIEDLILGILFIWFGIKVLISKDKKFKHLDNLSLTKWALVGAIMSILNFDAILFIFTASREVGIATISEAYKVGLLLMNSIFFVLPILLPLTLYLIVPNTAGKLCRKLNFYVIRYSAYILFILFILFGIILLKRAFVYLI